MVCFIVNKKKPRVADGDQYSKDEIIDKRGESIDRLSEEEWKKEYLSFFLSPVTNVEQHISVLNVVDFFMDIFSRQTVTPIILFPKLRDKTFTYNIVVRVKVKWICR